MPFLYKLTIILTDIFVFCKTFFGKTARNSGEDATKFVRVKRCTGGCETTTQIVITPQCARSFRINGFDNFDFDFPRFDITEPFSDQTLLG